jgi:delta11-fatty-acid desaturase
MSIERVVYEFPGGNISKPNLAELPNIVYNSLLGEPRSILQVLGWSVGDAYPQRCAAAFAISSMLAGIAICIYIVVAYSCCHLRKRQALASKRRAAQSRLKADSDPTSNNGFVAHRSPHDPMFEMFWTIHNKRYDMRNFVEKHPGGIDAITLGQGRNCTELFESYHSLARERLVRMTLAKYFVEDAPPHAHDYETVFEWQETPFFDMLKARARVHFQQKKGARSHRANVWQLAQLIGFVIASGFALRGFMYADLVSMLLLPFCYWWGPSPCMHDGSHFSLSHRPWVNRLCANIGGAHMSLYSWYHQHVIGHHVHTNIPGRDPDLYHFAKGADSGDPGFRTSIELRTLPERTFTGASRSCFWRQGLMMRVPLTTFGPSLIWDWYSLLPHGAFNSFLGIVPFLMISDSRLSVHSVGRAIVLWLSIIHPITVNLVFATGWLSGALYAMLFVVYPFAIHGCLFYIFSQLSHIQPQCFTTKVDEKDAALWHHSHPLDKNEIRYNRKKARLVAVWNQEGTESAPVFADADETQVRCPTGHLQEWAVHQIEHAADYCVDSRLWLHIANGLNLQVVHHLFPQVAWGHYRDLSRIIKDVSEEFGIKYSTSPSFSAAVASHFKYLACINEGPLASVWVRPPEGYAIHETMNALDQVDWSPSAGKLK